MKKINLLEIYCNHAEIIDLSSDFPLVRGEYVQCKINAGSNKTPLGEEYNVCRGCRIFKTDQKYETFYNLAKAKECSKKERVINKKISGL